MTSLGELLEAMADPRMRHAAVVHLPVALSVLGLPLALALPFTRKRALPLRWIVCGLYLALTATALVATQSGAAARVELGESANAARILLERHEWMARRVWILALLTASTAAAAGLAAPRVAHASLAVCVTGAATCALWVGLVGHHGGTAVYAYGAGTPSPLTDRDLEVEPAGERAGSDPRLQHFATEVRPLLVEHCMGCHGSGAFAAGGLDLTSMSGLLAGGERGPALVVGDPEASLLYQAVSGIHDSLRMPLDREPLDDEQLESLRVWIEQGAVWAD